MATIINGTVMDDGCDPSPEDIARDQLIEELAEQCTCTPTSLRPCDGLMAGGLCDDLHMDEPSGGDDD